VLDIVENLLGRVETLLVAAVVIMAIWFVVWTWVRTRSLVPVISALLVGAVIIWGVTNYTDLQDYVDDDVEELDG
jgi:O-antigen ligase